MKEGFCQAFVFKLIELFAPLLSSVQKAVSSFGAENTIETFFSFEGNVYPRRVWRIEECCWAWFGRWRGWGGLEAEAAEG